MHRIAAKSGRERDSKRLRALNETLPVNVKRKKPSTGEENYSFFFPKMFVLIFFS